MKAGTGKRLAALRAALLISAIGIVFSFLAGIYFRENSLIFQNRDRTSLCQINHYDRKEILCEDAPRGIATEYRFTLGESLNRDSVLSFCVVHQYVQVYLDGERIYGLEASAGKDNIKTIGSNWVMIPLFREDARKEILVVVTPVYESYRNYTVEFLLGSELDVYRHQLLVSMPQLCISAILMLSGLCFVGLGICSWFTGKHYAEATYLGLSVMMIGLWRIADTGFSPFLLPEKPLFLYNLSLTMLMMAPVVIMQSIRNYFHRELVPYFDVFGILESCVCIVLLLAQYQGIADLRQNLIVIHGLILLALLFVSAMILYERIRFPMKKVAFSGKFMYLLFTVGIVLDFSTFYATGSSSGLPFTLIVLLCYLVIRGIGFLKSYGEQMRLYEKKIQQLQETESQLIASRTTTMLSQIRSHFIFNILNAISGMCKYDPEKADETVVRFARFLRTNINILQDDTPVYFMDALDHLEDYIALEQIRFGDRIQFEEDIQASDFVLPSLIIQPIVENAIKHGLTPKPQGGTVVLRTWKEEKNVFISIEDDGIGFDPETVDVTKSVGLENVRLRLHHMVGGSLQIESVPGHGTIVTIRIPV